MQNSPKAAEHLISLIQDDSEATMSEWDDAMGETDCPEGCYVEPDGICSHGYRSAGLSAGVI